MRVLCVFGRHAYGKPARGESYEHTNFVPTLHKLGHEVLFFESWDMSRFKGVRELNEALLRTVESEKPDVVFSVMFSYEIWLETWRILRDSGLAATVNWTTDDSWRYPQFSRFLAPVFHAFTTTYPAAYDRYKKDGCKRVLLTQWAACSAALHPPLPTSDCCYAVSFVGAAHGDRRHWIEALRTRGIEVDCFGHGWARGPVAASDVSRVIRESVVTLNFSGGARTLEGLRLRRGRQLKARIFEVPGAGGFLLTERTEGLDRWFVPGEEISVFEGIDELESKVRYYLSHPLERDAIARRGYERTRAEHTYEKRLAEALDFAVRQREAYFEDLGYPPAGKIDWAAFEEACRRHVTGWGLRCLKGSLVAACSALWGQKRGPMAARRLVFEISWRLVGARTYSAAGWPGRMF